MTLQLRKIAAWLGRVGIAFLILVVLYVVAPSGWFSLLAGLGAITTGTWLGTRLMLLAARRVIWRLRNRLLVTYVFIAVVPLLLVVTLAALSAILLLSQTTAYLVTTELDRRIDTLRAAAVIIATADARLRQALAAEIRQANLSRYPGLEIIVRQPTNIIHEPSNGTEPLPKAGWKGTSGVLARDKRSYFWAYAPNQNSDVIISAPLTPEVLSSLTPHLGPLRFVQTELADGKGKSFYPVGSRTAAVSVTVPPAVSAFDYDINWFATVPMLDWDHPNQVTDAAVVQVHSRISAVVGAVFDQSSERAQGFVKFAIIAVAVVFIIVEIICLIIGVTMTRTITGAVHRLYEGTGKIREGDFSHRIAVSGRDQLGDLSTSFNQMTENLEKLLVVAKEKERLQSEIEIARDVQAQLFPRSIPQLKELRLKAVCHPARMVSGDYYGFELIHGSQVALAIADVAGKGISAALLMAALQSSLRTQLEDSLEAAADAGGGSGHVVSTSRLVSRLNRQLHATTSTEKYATFCLGVFDPKTSMFTYTNAGHLPPLLIHEGAVERLEVNGTVVGAFSFATYTESKVELRPGDLLVFYTDGITEPENEYGEMYGEERLIDLLERNAHRGEDEIIDLILDSVRQFAKTGEAQDDMTLLIARRV